MFPKLPPPKKNLAYRIPRVNTTTVLKRLFHIQKVHEAKNPALCSYRSGCALWTLSAEPWVSAVERGLRHPPRGNGGGYCLRIYLNIHRASSILISSFKKKRWLCFPVWHPLNREELLIRCRVQPCRTKLEWKPLRPPGQFIIHKRCKASQLHPFGRDSGGSRAFTQSPPFCGSLYQGGSRETSFFQAWTAEMGFVWMKRCLKFLGEVGTRCIFKAFWSFIFWGGEGRWGVRSGEACAFCLRNLRTVARRLSKMPEANYLLSVSWGYIKVGAFRVLWRVLSRMCNLDFCVLLVNMSWLHACHLVVQHENVYCPRETGCMTLSWNLSAAFWISWCQFSFPSLFPSSGEKKRLSFHLDFFSP